MYTVHQNDQPRERILLVGVDWIGQSPQLLSEHMEELRLLTETAYGEVSGEVIQRRDRQDKTTFIGRGKAESLVRQAEELGCDAIIFDDDLSPTQQRNLQRMAGTRVKVIDRAALILYIFALHARTREAKAQVELAQLQYLLPRLTRQWTHLERQQGGIGTRGGPGEKQIEVDRRLIRRRIGKLKEELVRIAHERDIQSRRRQSAYRISLVGYTNAGKSTLMNALTDAHVFIEDRLFATLDTTTRKLDLNDNQTILLSDTVGFIRKLPHHLIASFRSTLAEVADADLLLKVVDASSSHMEKQLATINEVLEDLGLGEKQHLLVLNKMDAITNGTRLTALNQQYADAVLISARQRLRLDRLEEAIRRFYRDDYEECQLRIDSARTQLISAIYQVLDVKKRRFEEDETVLTVYGKKETIRTFRVQIDDQVA